MTGKPNKSRTIRWYRTPLPKDEMKKLTQRSDLLGFLQAGGHLGLIGLFFSGAVYAQLHHSWLLMMACVFGYGMTTAFTINAVHELVHGTVFRSKPLNNIFAYIFGFIGQDNHLYFWESHKEHHRYTLHQPDDLEVVEPEMPSVRKFFLNGILSFDLRMSLETFIRQWRRLRGQYDSEWEAVVMASASPEKRKAIVRFGAIILFGHLLLSALALLAGLWIVPVLLLLHRQFGNLPFQLCNSTQHVGLQDAVPDFRQCCRTIHLGPVLRFLYWHMNYHIEHHMYAAVPCYRLGKLHQLIKHDLPPTPQGLIQTWREINQILARQKVDPTYRYIPPVPQPEGQS